MRRALLLILIGIAGCSPPRSLGPVEPREAAAGPISSTHYRTYESAEALAEALRWTPGSSLVVSAHRGGPRAGLPENALATFEHALNYAPALLECDVRTTADRTLVLLHDETLDRTTTGTGSLDMRTLPELRRLRLRDQAGTITPYRIPTLAEALAWAEDRAVLLLDVKEGVSVDTLIETIRNAGAENRVIVIAYTLSDLLDLYRLAPDLNYSATATTVAETEALLAAPVNHDRLIAFSGVGSVDRSIVDRLHGAGIRVQIGTFGAIDEAATEHGPEAYDALLEAGVDVLATDNVPAAARAVRPVRVR